MRRLLALLLLLATACTTEAPAPPSPSPSDGIVVQTAGDDMHDTLAALKLPSNDPFALARRLRGREGTPGAWEPVRSVVPNRPIGERASFFYYNFRTKKNEQVSAVIRHRSEHAYWYVQEDVSIDPARLAQTALDFEGRIYPTDRRNYGEEWSPGIDNDPRITVLFARIPDVAGYFSSADEFPKWVNEFSAEREMIYINVDAAQPGSTYLLSVLAHEFAHMIQFNKRKRSVIWFNEGQAQLAEYINGFAPGGTFSPQFFREPDTQLTDWKDEPGESAAHYGHAFLFLHYLSERFGGVDLIRELMAGGVDTPLDLDRALRARGTTVEDAYLDFVATNAFADRSSAPAPYRYQQLRLPPTARLGRDTSLEIGQARRSKVHQFAARYFELPAGKLSIDFQGTTRVRLLPTDPHSGRFLWWSNRGDAIDTTLTRRVDLRGVSSATLRFWTWFEIEKDFDYAYVAISADDGKTWRTLPGTTTSTTDPNGNNLGNGISGTSGGGTTPTWVEERMDLTPFAGKEILLRFEQVTDGALNKDGFAVDDISIPEIGWRDDAESPGDWEAAGFVRSSNLVREQFALQVLRLGDHPSVERVRPGADGRARLEVEVAERGSVLLAVTAFALQTTQPGAFEIRVDKLD